MIRNLLHIHLIQLFRELAKIGILRLLLLPVCAVAVFNFLLIKVSDITTTSYYLLALASLILFIHLKRKDKQFVFLLSDKPHWIFFSQYIFFSLPFIVFGFTKQSLLTIAFILFLFLISFIQPKLLNGKRQYNSFSFISNDLFEWKAGVRKNLLSIASLYLLTLVICPASAFFVVFYFLLLGVLLSFYSESEPLNVLVLAELSPKKLIRQKLKRHLSGFFLFVLPIFVWCLVLHSDYWHLILIGLLASVNLFIFSILSKYSHYEPGTHSSFHELINALAFAGTFIPPFFIVVMIMNVRFYKKSITHLNNFLNDFN